MTKFIPDIKNLSLDDAKDTLDKSKIKYDDENIEERYSLLTRKGHVIETEPKIGSEVKKGDVVKLTVSKLCLLPFILMMAAFIIGLIIIEKNTFSNINNNAAPIISVSDTDWAPTVIVSVSKDAKFKDGYDHYDVCILPDNDNDINKCNWIETRTKNIVLSESGIWHVYFRGVDKNGNFSKISKDIIAKVDNDAPSVDQIKSKVDDNYKLTIEVNSKDSLSGVDKTYYKINDGEYIEFKDRLEIENVNGEDKYVVTIRIVDQAGNEIEKTFDLSKKVYDAVKEIEERKKTAETEQNGNNSNSDSENNNGEFSSVGPIPSIDLDDVPSVIKGASNYSLPSHYDFGGSLSGSFTCVDEKNNKVTSTNNLHLGTHVVSCTIINEKGNSARTSKKVIIEIDEGEDEEIDGWIRYNIYYPDNSTNWEWRLDKGDTIRTGVGTSDWQPYTGPIFIRIEDIENIYIRYDLEDGSVVVPPRGRVLVDINPEEYAVKDGEKTTVSIIYDQNALRKEYRINGGDWKTYTSSFEVTNKTLIEARAYKEEAIYDSNGDFIRTNHLLNTDQIYISQFKEDWVYGGKKQKDGESALLYLDPEVLNGGRSTPGSCVENFCLEPFDGPIINSNPSSGLVTSTTITITTKEEPESIYYKIGSGDYVLYTGPFDMNKNGIIETYYIRKSDYKKSNNSSYLVDNVYTPGKPYVRIEARPTAYLSDEQKEANVSIVASNYDKLEYSFDNVFYQEYKTPLIVTEATTIYAKATSSTGITIEKGYIKSTTAPKPKEGLDIAINVSPSKEQVIGLINQAQVTIDFDERATEKYYRTKFGDWQIYTGPFTIDTNALIEAYCINNGAKGYEKYQVDYLTANIAEPMINANYVGDNYYQVKITYAQTASTKKYRINGVDWIDYTDTLFVEGGNSIEAYNEDTLNNKAMNSIYLNAISNAGTNSTIIDRGDYYLIVNNYPETSDPLSRAYKWKQDGIWKSYNPNGWVLIKQKAKDKYDLANSSSFLVENQKGEKVNIPMEHVYVLDVPTSELDENIYIRFNMEQPAAPVISIDPTYPTTKVNVAIFYSDHSYDKKYKVVKPDGTNSGWLDYTGTFDVEENGTIIYAKCKNSQGDSSKISSYRVINIDTSAPTITVSGDFTTIQRTVNVLVDAVDDIAIDQIKYMYGEHTVEDFEGNGEPILLMSSFIANKNGKYTIFASDKIGNKVVKVIEIKNIDDVAPNITFNVECINLLQANITINYDDATIKEYRIGNTGDYSNYTKTLTLKSSELISLANSDGTISVYAKGRDSLGNETSEIEEKISCIDLDQPNAPVINASSGYPTISEYGIQFSTELNISYDNREDIDNYVSFDGTNWEPYSNFVNATSGIVYAKSVKKESGLESNVVSNSIATISNSLSVSAYDGNTNTSDTLINGDKYLYITDSINKPFTIYVTADYYDSKLNYRIYDENNKVIQSITDDYNRMNTTNKVISITIPSGAKKIGFYWCHAGNYGTIKIKNITLKNDPTINCTSNYPIISEFGIEAGSEDCTISYHQSASEKLYKINNGEWTTYTGTIHLNYNDTLYAKSIDKYDKVSTQSSYTSAPISNALGAKAFDGNTSTYETLSNSDKYIYIADTINKPFKIQITADYSDSKMDYRIYDSKNNIIQSVTDDSNRMTTTNKVTTITIPSGAKKIGLYWTRAGNYGTIKVKNIVIRNEPLFNCVHNYGTITRQGIVAGSNDCSINYYQSAITKLYKIGNGTWNNYSSSVHLNYGQVLYAKSIDKNNKESLQSSYTSAPISNALGAEAFDGNNNTYVTLSNTEKFLSIDESIDSAFVITITADYIDSKMNYVIYNKNNQVIQSVTDDGNRGSGGNAVMTISIPKGARKIGFYWCRAGNYGRILIRNITTNLSNKSSRNLMSSRQSVVSTILNDNNPIINLNNNEVSIDYKDELTHEYSLDYGETWVSYVGPFVLEENTTIIARSVDSEDKVVNASTYTVTSIKKEETKEEETTTTTTTQPTTTTSVETTTTTVVTTEKVVDIPERRDEDEETNE